MYHLNNCWWDFAKTLFKYIVNCWLPTDCYWHVKLKFLFHNFYVLQIKYEPRLNQANFDKRVVKWISLMYIPFNFFENDKFLVSRAARPKKTHYETSLCFILRNKKSFRWNFTKQSKNFFLCRRMDFCGITAHFIDENWKLRSLVLNFISSKESTPEKTLPKYFLKLYAFHTHKVNFTVISLTMLRQIQSSYDNLKS